MPRNLTNPITRQPVTKQAITSFYLVIGYTGANPDPAKTFFEYRVANLDPAGQEVGSQTRRVYFADMPNILKTKLRDIRDLVITDAENLNILEPGTDEADL